MIRTLLATFLTMWLPLLLIAAGILLVVKSRSARGGANAKFYTGALLLSVPLGLIAYIVSGMIAAALHGGGMDHESDRGLEDLRSGDHWQRECQSRLQACR